MGTQGIREGVMRMQGIMGIMGMRGIRVEMLGIRVRTQGIEVGMRGIGGRNEGNQVENLHVGVELID